MVNSLKLMEKMLIREIETVKKLKYDIRHKTLIGQISISKMEVTKEEVNELENKPVKVILTEEVKWGKND